MRYPNCFLCNIAFSEFAKELLWIEDDNSFDSDGARNVLARTVLTSEVVYDYGRILTLLLKHGASESQDGLIDIDAHLLMDFLVATQKGMVQSSLLEELSDEADFAQIAFTDMDTYNDVTRQGLEFIRSFLRTALQFETKTKAVSTSVHTPTPMDNVLICLSSSLQGHPALAFLVKNKLVDPAGILDYLMSFYSKAHDPWNTSTIPWKTTVSSRPEDSLLKSTAVYAFLKALSPLIARGHWQPETSHQHELLWMVHARVQKEHADIGIEWETHFMQAMVHAQPQHLHHALNYVLTRVHVSDPIMEVFFPIPLAQCSGPEVLECLVQFIEQLNTDPADQKASAFLLRLDQYHHDVMDLLNLHFAVCPSYEEGVATWEAMLDTFEDICSGRPPTLCIDTIDSRVFE